MVRTILLCCSLIGADDTRPPADSFPNAGLATYHAEREKAGKTAADQIRLALWCESHDLPAERIKHLVLAIAYDPSNALARGLMGLVGYRGQWKNPDRVKRAVKVTAIEDGEVVPVFNLDVADDADFFVGQQGALAHDNTLPNLREAAFDAVTTLARSARP